MQHVWARKSMTRTGRDIQTNTLNMTAYHRHNHHRQHHRFRHRHTTSAATASSDIFFNISTDVHHHHTPLRQLISKGKNATEHIIICMFVCVAIYSTTYTSSYFLFSLVYKYCLNMYWSVCVSFFWTHMLLICKFITECAQKIKDDITW